MDLSVVIPFSPQEDLLPGLLKDLRALPLKEIILVGEQEIKISQDPKIRFVKSPIGRAKQMNKGAEDARGKFLWFLHADSRVGVEDFNIFINSLLSHPKDLLYFNLNFLPHSFKLSLNKFGARFRSDYLKLPFGDQGLALSKENFQKLAGYPLVPIGEDLIFAITAKKMGLKIRNSGAEIYTSSRKYEKYGWVKTTLTHLFYTFKIVLGRKTI